MKVVSRIIIGTVAFFHDLKCVSFIFSKLKKGLTRNVWQFFFLMVTLHLNVLINLIEKFVLFCFHVLVFYYFSCLWSLKFCLFGKKAMLLYLISKFILQENFTADGFSTLLVLIFFLSTLRIILKWSSNIRCTILISARCTKHAA